MRVAHFVAAGVGVVAMVAGRARAEEAGQDTAPATAPCSANQPPLLGEHFTVVPSPAEGGFSEAVLHVGRPVQVVLDAKDPDGDALTFSARPLPTRTGRRTFEVLATGVGR